MKQIVAIALAVLVALILVAYFFMSTPSKEPETDLTSDIAEQQKPEPRRELPKPPKAVQDKYELVGELPLLEDSDSRFVSHLGLLLNSLSLRLIKPEQIIRKIVLQVENAAEGKLVYNHSPLVGPNAPILVSAVDEQTYQLDTASYQRYNDHAALLSTVDTGLLVAFYQFYEPLFDEAYAELGYDEGAFRGRLIQAIDGVLATPIIEKPILLVQPEANYLYVDESLEKLTQVQKQLLRMGPANAQAIQAALLRFKARIQ